MPAASDFRSRAAMSMVPPVVLVYGDTQAEVKVSHDASIEDLASEAELAFGLDPQSFSFRDSHGKVETTAALHRAMRLSAAVASTASPLASSLGNIGDVGDGCLILEVDELPAFKRIRDAE